MSRRKLVALLVISSMAVVIVGLLMGQIGRPMRYELPLGFKRWATIRYENPTCPPLPTQGIFLIVSVPPSGELCTSTAHPDGWIFYEFYYIYPNGAREAIPLHSGPSPETRLEVWLLAYQPQEKWELDFVGTKLEADRWGSPPYPWRSKNDRSTSDHPKAK